MLPYTKALYKLCMFPVAESASNTEYVFNLNTYPTLMLCRNTFNRGRRG